VLTDLSDMGAVMAARKALGIPWSAGGMAASLDHAMWFHRPCRLDDWLLYTQDSPSASGARGLTRGNIFTRQGELVASVAQEGLIRKRAND
jgi:acyl-CoA thioesterase-2